MKPLSLVLALLIAPVWAQKLDFNLNGFFDRLGAKAKEKQEVNLDADVLQKLAPEMKLPVGSVKAVVVRNYEFEKKGEYDVSQLADLGKQARDGGWTRIITAKEDDELTEIYILKQGDQMAGLLVIAAEATELSVVYIEGNVSMDQLDEVVESSIKYDTKSLEQ